jgi:hypothetical protein
VYLKTSKKRNKQRKKMLTWHKRHFPKGSLVSWKQITPLGHYDLVDVKYFGIILGYELIDYESSCVLKLKIQTNRGIHLMSTKQDFYRSEIKCLQLP